MILIAVCIGVSILALLSSWVVWLELRSGDRVLRDELKRIIASTDRKAFERNRQARYNLRVELLGAIEKVKEDIQGEVLRSHRSHEGA